MSSFDFHTTEESEQFCLRIRNALVAFFGVTERQAVELINEYWKDVESIDSDPFLLSEPPYYYAMCIGHHPVFGDGQPRWEQDEKWWPPPAGWER
jgi:hypothetical protein